MNVFIFTDYAKKCFKKIPNKMQNRIKDKLISLKTHPSILKVLKSLSSFKDCSHRLRVGNYRIILKLLEKTDNLNTFLVIDLEHRREVCKHKV